MQITGYVDFTNNLYPHDSSLDPGPGTDLRYHSGALHAPEAGQKALQPAQHIANAGGMGTVGYGERTSCHAVKQILTGNLNIDNKAVSMLGKRWTYKRIRC